MRGPAGHSEGADPPIGAVLAGGRGARLGGAKATADLAGRPLISYAIAAVEAAGLEPVVVAKRDSELPDLSCRTIREPDLPRHPLRGLVAALRDAGERPVIAIGCDMPFAEPLLTALAAAPGPLVVASTDGRPQPLPGRYEPALLAALEAALLDELPLRSTLAALRPREIAGAELARIGDPRRLCFNVNTPADLRRAERMLEAPAR